MPYATIAEAEARIAELEKENNSLTRESKSYRLSDKKLKDFFEGKGFDLSSDLEEQWTQTAGKQKSDLDSLSAKFDKISKQLEKAEKEKAELAEQATYGKIKSELSEKMKDVIGADELIELWLSKKKISTEGNKPTFNDDGDEIPLDKAIEKYRKTHPERVKITQNSGSGSSGSQQKEQGTGTEAKKIKADEFYAMDKKAKDTFIKSGGQIEQPVAPY